MEALPFRSHSLSGLPGRSRRPLAEARRLCARRPVGPHPSSLIGGVQPAIVVWSCSGRPYRQWGQTETDHATAGSSLPGLGYLVYTPAGRPRHRAQRTAPSRCCRQRFKAGRVGEGVSVPLRESSRVYSTKVLPGLTPAAINPRGENNQLLLLAAAGRRSRTVIYPGTASVSADSGTVISICTHDPQADEARAAGGPGRHVRSKCR